RLLTLERPATLQTRIQVESSAATGVMTLGPLVPEGFTLMALESPLPARLEDDGRITVQLAAGRWDIQARLRALSDIREIPAIRAGAPWPEQEIWSVDPAARAGRVSVSGSAVDPGQAAVPEPWRRWGAWKIDATGGLSLSLSEEPVSMPPLQLSAQTDIWWVAESLRPLWHTRLTGQAGATGALDWQRDWQPLRAESQGQAVPIQVLAGGHYRLPLTRAQLDLTVTGMLQTPSTARHATLSGNPLSEPLQEHRLRLHVPVGERLIAVGGAGSARGTWMSRWSLWDLFFASLIVLAIGRRFGVLAGVLAIPVVILSWQERFAPVWIWLLLVVAYALPVAGPLSERWVVRLKAVAWGVLAIQVVIFGVSQTQKLLYPQLDERYHEPAWPSLSADSTLREAAVMTSMAESAVRKSVPEDRHEKPVAAESLPVEVGPGLPAGRYTSAEVTLFRGGDTTLSVWRLGEGSVRALRVTLLALLSMLIAVLVMRSRTLRAASMLLVTLCLFSGHPPEAHAGEYPPQAMLDELKAELLRPASCHPDCVTTGHAEMVVDAYSLSLSLSVAAAEARAMRLPRVTDSQMPVRWFLDGTPVRQIWRDAAGDHWVRVPAGVHEWVLNLSLKDLDRLTLSWPDSPTDLAVQVRDWRVEGVRGRQLAGQTLTLTRLALPAREAEPRPAFAAPEVVPYVEVVRELELGRAWRVQTWVLRRAPLRGDVEVRVPLLKGEAPLTDLSREDGAVRLTLRDGQSRVGWTSTLPATSGLTLQAPPLSERVETWSLRADARWQVKWSGPVPGRWMGPGGQWQPTWQPEPGERLQLDIQPAQLLTGQYLNVDAVRIQQVRSGGRDYYEAEWTLRASAQETFSTGGLEGVERPQAWLNGQPLPARVTRGVVAWPIPPGVHQLRLTWETPVRSAAMRAPALDFVGIWQNLHYSQSLARDRWVLWTWGPTDGPAILFWGTWLALLAVAIVLGRHAGNPLHTTAWVLLATGAALGWVGALPAVALWVYGVAWGTPRIVRLQGWRRKVAWAGLSVLTVIAVGAVLASIPRGLTGLPPDYVSGIGSHAHELVWRVDWVDGQLPELGAWSVPVWLYRVIMLLWALWLAFALTGWLKWMGSVIVNARKAQAPESRALAAKQQHETEVEDPNET
ncbi:MAG: hypothetical protein D6758_04940, partial [Gammaproteobacteria bacterium]